MYHPMTQSNANCIHKPHLFSSCYLYCYFFSSHSFIHCRRGFPWSAQILQSERLRSSLCVCHVATWQFFSYFLLLFSVILSSLNAFHFRHGCVKMASSQSNSVDLLPCIHQDANWINGHFHNSCRSEKIAMKSFAFVRTRFFLSVSFSLSFFPRLTRKYTHNSNGEILRHAWMDQGKIHYCRHEIAQPVINRKRNTGWSNKCKPVYIDELREKKSPTAEHSLFELEIRELLVYNLQQYTQYARLRFNSCAIWMWHYLSTPFIQIAAIFIPLCSLTIQYWINSSFSSFAGSIFMRFLFFLSVKVLNACVKLKCAYT